MRCFIVHQITKTVDWGLIQTHWQDLIQVVLSIQAGRVLPRARAYFD
ncbi:Tn3 family transposase [Xenorhabdus nematophila]